MTLFPLNIFGSIVTQFSLTIPCVNYDSFFAIDLKRQAWVSFSCWFLTSFVTQFSMMISRSIVTQFSLTIYRSVVTQFSLTTSGSPMTWFSLTISCVCRNSNFDDDFEVCSDIVFPTSPCVSHESIFAIDFMRLSWIHWHCRFHTSAFT
jgi:hypothetical protein